MTNTFRWAFSLLLLLSLASCIKDEPLNAECDITESKQVLVESLTTIYHTRIAYPELNKPAAPEPAPPRRKYFFGRNA